MLRTTLILTNGVMIYELFANFCYYYKCYKYYYKIMTRMITKTRK